MDVPPEILQTSMRTHQKYFSLRDPKTGKMANRFALVANMIASDAGREIVAGNERVLRARLSDAKFFWDQDRKRTLESRVDDLKGIVFHAKLGTQYERVERIVALAGEIAQKIGADVEKAKRAALLCKADLTSGVVGEFPELQGVMGRYYALHDGEDVEVADAVRDHYRPVGPSDTVPGNLVSASVALADKMDALAAFFSIDEIPTGSGDPYALRRAVLGAIRIILDGGLRIDIAFDAIQSVLQFTTKFGRDQLDESVRQVMGVAKGVQVSQVPSLALLLLGLDKKPRFEELKLDFLTGLNCMVRIRDFVLDRMEVLFRTQGKRVDVVQAAKTYLVANELTKDGSSRSVVESNIVLLVRKVSAIESFLTSDDGHNLLAGYKRAANILKAEEKKDKTTFDGEPDAGLLVLPEEKALADALSLASKSIADDVAAEKFVEAMGVMAKLRAPVDAFFDKVTVNDKDAKLRENRLRLLSRLRATLHQVADFSKIEG
jgi:glycyl-tRNA synthetase beta chain